MRFEFLTQSNVSNAHFEFITQCNTSKMACFNNYNLFEFIAPTPVKRLKLFCVHPRLRWPGNARSPRIVVTQHLSLYDMCVFTAGVHFTISTFQRMICELANDLKGTNALNFVVVVATTRIKEVLQCD